MKEKTEKSKTFSFSNFSLDSNVDDSVDLKIEENFCLDVQTRINEAKFESEIHIWYKNWPYKKEEWSCNVDWSEIPIVFLLQLFQYFSLSQLYFLRFVFKRFFVVVNSYKRFKKYLSFTNRICDFKLGSHIVFQTLCSLYYETRRELKIKY